jgi:two-component system response regulator AlgR
MSDATSILIVDDEPPARARLREVLADLAPEFPHRIVGEAANAPEALAQIESQRPQIVLMDVQMPGMTGIELARHISARAGEGDSEDPKPMPLMIFVTAFDEFAVDAFEVNALDYLLKPVRGQRTWTPSTRWPRQPTPAGATCRCMSVAASSWCRWSRSST